MGSTCVYISTEVFPFSFSNIFFCIIASLYIGTDSEISHYLGLKLFFFFPNVYIYRLLPFFSGLRKSTILK